MPDIVVVFSPITFVYFGFLNKNSVFLFYFNCMYATQIVRVMHVILNQLSYTLHTYGSEIDNICTCYPLIQ